MLHSRASEPPSSFFRNLHIKLFKVNSNSDLRGCESVIALCSLQPCNLVYIISSCSMQGRFALCCYMLYTITPRNLLTWCINLSSSSQATLYFCFARPLASCLRSLIVFIVFILPPVDVIGPKLANSSISTSLTCCTRRPLQSVLCDATD